MVQKIALLALIIGQGHAFAADTTANLAKVLLESGNPAQQEAAVWQLAAQVDKDRGPNPKQTAQILLNALDSGTRPNIRLGAAVALGRMDKDAVIALPRLIGYSASRLNVTGPYGNLRTYSGEAIGKIGRYAVPYLVQLYKDTAQKIEFRREAQERLSFIAKDLPKDSEEAKLIVTAFSDMVKKRDEVAVDANLIELTVVWGLAKLGYASEPAIPVLENYLQDAYLVGINNKKYAIRELQVAIHQIVGDARRQKEAQSGDRSGIAVDKKETH